ncbi:MAG TPA: hypothetical protein VEG60_20930 [Candidatus Binatia bacterium]|nr:hypothetical protein [Candidatus Binatia bacterium]
MKTHGNRSGRSSLIAGGSVPKPKQLRAGGLEPTDSMAPGEYIAHCEGATIKTKGRNTIAALEFRVIEGSHSGTALRQWITIPEVDGLVPLGSRYGRQCALALGREIEPGDELSPAAIFQGRVFRIAVGYRMTEKSGGAASHENAQRRKDAKDFLRVHALIAEVELP